MSQKKSIVIYNEDMVRWPSGLRRQTKEFPNSGISGISGPKGRGFESHSHHMFSVFFVEYLEEVYRIIALSNVPRLPATQTLAVNIQAPLS